jgi:hypothetical protein
VTGFSNFYIMKSEGVLPIRWVSVGAKWQTTDVARVAWEVSDHLDVAQFVVEHSLDGRSFLKAGTFPAGSATQYFCNIPAPGAGVHYFRVVAEEKDGGKNYSAVRTLQKGTGGSPSLYPNPVTNKLTLGNVEGYTKYRLTNMAGIIIREGNLTGPYTIGTEQLAAGNYILVLSGPANTHALVFSKK